MTVYDLKLRNDDGSIPDNVWIKIKREPWMRPRVGQALQYRGKLYYVTQQIPAEVTDDTVFATYILDTQIRTDNDPKS